MGDVADALLGVVTKSVENPQTFGPQSHVGLSSEGKLHSWSNSAPQRTGPTPHCPALGNFPKKGDAPIFSHIHWGVPVHREVKTWLNVHVRGGGYLRWAPDDTDDISFIDSEGEHNFRDFLKSWLKQLIDEHEEHLIAAGLKEGEYRWQKLDPRTFEPGEMLLEGHDIDKIELIVDGVTAIVSPPIQATFNVAERGAASFYIPVEFPAGFNVKLNLITYRADS
jgi:hypothetical protein